MPQPHRFCPIDHTADLGLQVWGESLEALYVNAAEGMGRLLFNLPAVRPREQRLVTAEGYDREELLVDWLGELLYLAEVEEFLPCSFEITLLEDTRLEAVVRGEPFDSARHHWRAGIKAATYHDLHIVQEAGGAWMVRVIFDT